ICWFDPSSKTSLFEPVGTRADHRRKGLGLAMMLEGLRRLRALGAEDSLVTHAGNNEAAARLYRDRRASRSWIGSTCTAASWRVSPRCGFAKTALAAKRVTASRVRVRSGRFCG
ncbi:MAG: GNAT family N-acetyltransferase, partial [Rubrobacteraceae bacterium]